MKDFREEHRGRGGIFLVLENTVSSGSKLESLLIWLAVICNGFSFEPLLMSILLAAVVVTNHY
jgi:hypothetical protein